MRIIFFFFFFTTTVFAQNNKQQLAYQYYYSGDYEKAIIIYKEISKKSISVNSYNPYFNSLLKLEKFIAAEKLAKRMFSKNSKNLNYQADIVVCQFKKGNIKLSNYNLSKIHKKLSGNKSQTIRIANVFLRHKMYSKAIEIYDVANNINNDIDFGLQRAQLYSFLGDDKNMVIQYLKVVENNPLKKQFVFSSIQKFLDNNGIKNIESYNLVKKYLVQYVNKYSKRTEFSEMLIWLFMQNQKYNLALSQAIALDRRTNNDLLRVYNIAESLLDKKKFLIAIIGLDYIIDKGKSSNYYIDAQINKLYALTFTNSKNKLGLEKIKKKYIEVISELGKNKNTVILLSNFAHFHAFYLNDLKSANDILKEAMLLPGIDLLDLAMCKIEYADIKLLSNQVWDALLYYSQVEKDFKENPIGHKAKFKRAKIAYYQGDFSWAQAQLDVLKASTSKLVANDAMELSLLISDNYDLDTTELPMLSFARADLAFFQNNFDLSLSIYDSILNNFPSHQLSDEIYYRKSYIFKSMNQLDSSISMLMNIINEYDYEILIDDALFDLAKIYDFRLSNISEAMKYYEKIILEFPGSIYASECRNRYRFLRGDKIQN